MSEEEQNVQDFQKGYLTLPFDNENLKDFITSLLGTPQTIKKRIKGVFEVEIKDLQNFHELISQRVFQQNNGKLIQLKTEIYFDDESSVILNDYTQLISYNEVKPIISEAVRLTWSYLIQFPNKKTPEKQQIEIMIISTPERNVTEDDDIPIFIPILGQFRVIIQHTDRTWGGDIETLITNQINSIIKENSKWKKFCKRKRGTIGVLGSLTFLISSLIGIYYRTLTFNEVEIARINNFIENSTQVSEKTDFLIKYIALNSQGFFSLKSQLFILVSFFLALGLGTWVSSLANIQEKSFLIMTRKAKTNSEEQKEKSKKKTRLFFISIGISILIGVISNYIFRYLTITF